VGQLEDRVAISERKLHECAGSFLARGSSEGPWSVVVAGPTCAGKSSLVSALPGSWNRYIEAYQENPHVAPMATGRPFDAFALQNWFLTRMLAWLSTTKPDENLLIEQDPGLIGLLYSSLWFRQGRLTAGEYAELLDGAIECYRIISLRGGRRALVLLTCDPALLQQRSSARDGSSQHVQWYVDLVDQTNELYRHFGSAVWSFDTGHVEAPETVRQVERLLIDQPF
jgi:deoxyadenosine/deoxycytidine kinase